jgi:hypothetical protein
VDVLKENLWAAPLTTEYGPVPALDDVIGTKVRAFADRGVVRGLIDVHAAPAHPTVTELERLGGRGRSAGLPSAPSVASEPCRCGGGRTFRVRDRLHHPAGHDFLRARDPSPR